MNDKKSGFTLIEVIVSIAILSIISVMFVSIFSQGILISKVSNQLSKDSSGAQKMAEILNGCTPSTTSIEKEIILGQATVSVPSPSPETTKTLPISIKKNVILYTCKYGDKNVEYRIIK